MPFLPQTIRERALLRAILSVALAIRLVHFLAILGTAFPEFPRVFVESDMNTFWEWSQTILAGDWLGRETYHPAFEWMKAIAPQETWYRWWGGRAIFQQAPLYVYWVAGMLTVSGGSLEFVSLAQLVLGVFQCLVMYSLGRRCFDARVGLIAAAVTAVYGPFILHQSALLRDWLPPLLEPLALVTLLKAREHQRNRDWALAGTALGLALLAKESVALFVPLTLLWVVWSYRGAVGRAAVPVAAILAGLLLVLSPLFARNVMVGAPPFAFSNRAAENLIAGNAADAFPIGFNHPPSMAGIMERSNGRVFTVVRETLATYDHDWRRLMRLQLLKLQALADPLEVPNNLNFYYAREISPILRFTVTYGMVFPFGMAGFILSIPAWRRHALLMLYTSATLAVLLSTFIVARFRLILVPILILYGAAGAVWLWEAVGARRKFRCVSYVALVTGIAIAQQCVLPIWSLRDMDLIGIYSAEYFTAANIYVREGRPDRAVAEIERLETIARARPSFSHLARAASLHEANFRGLLAEQLVTQRKTDAARREVERMEEIYAAHPGLALPSYNLGLLYLRLGEVNKARRYLERFLTLEPMGATAERARRLLAGMGS